MPRTVPGALVSGPSIPPVVVERVAEAVAPYLWKPGRSIDATECCMSKDI